MGLSALDRSLHISHGRKPVDKNGVEMPASEGAQDFIDFFISFAPYRAGNPGQPFYPGLVPGATFLRRSAAQTAQLPNVVAGFSPRSVTNDTNLELPQSREVCTMRGQMTDSKTEITVQPPSK